MNLAPQSCPQCGSPLQITVDGQAGVCPQCRTAFTLQLDVKINNLASLVRSGMEYLRQGDFNNAEEQSKKIIDLDASRGEGWLLKAATTFDVAQADQAFATGLRHIGEAERQEFALIFKPLALFVWKKANSMLVRDAGKPGMSRAARQHYEIKAKAAQLSAFAIELFPLSGWQEELTKYLPVKAWDEYTEAERIELFDMLTRFDSKASSDLGAFIAQRERLIGSLAEKLPEEYTTLFGQTENQDVSTGDSVARPVQPQTTVPSARARSGCSGWVALVFLIALLAGIVGILVTRNKGGAPDVATPANTVSATPLSKLVPPVVAQASEKSPLGDLIVQRPQKDEIWLACTDGSNHPVQLCEHDWRTGQVSFSPDEQWIVVTDGGGPGSSLGTELRAFRRESQNIYREVADAGIADEAADSVLHRRNAPAGTEMVHVYAQVDGWSDDGTKLKVRVWGDDGRLSGYHLEPTAVTYNMVGIRGKQPTAPQQTSSQPWLTYGQNVTLHGTLLKHYHTEYLDTLPDSAEGRRRAQTPAYILRLAAPISVRAADLGDSPSDPEQNEQEVYLSSTPQGAESLIDSLIGKQVAVSGKLDHAYNVHHPRPVMIDASTLSADPGGLNKGEQEMSAGQNAGTQNRATATSPIPQGSTDSDSDYALYTNRKHVYAVVLPAALASALQENASGDSVTASSNDGRIKVLLRVKQGVGTAETLYKQWTAEHTIRDPGKVVDYKTFHGNWFVVSGHDGPRGYYVKVVVRGSESLFLCLEYDEEQSSRLGLMLTRISRSFTGGIDDSSGTVVQATPPAAPRPTQTRAVDANAQPVPAAGSLSRREWRERLRKYCTIPSGHQLLSNEKRLFALMDKPDDVEHEGRNTYWYYKCSDGVVQLAFQLDPEMMGGQIIAEVSDR